MQRMQGRDQPRFIATSHYGAGISCIVNSRLTSGAQIVYKNLYRRVMVKHIAYSGIPFRVKLKPENQD